MGQRASQVAPVVIVQPDDAEARVTQLAPVVIIDTQPPALVSLFCLEMVRENTPDAVASKSRAFVVG